MKASNYETFLSRRNISWRKESLFFFVMIKTDQLSLQNVFDDFISLHATRMTTS